MISNYISIENFKSIKNIEFEPKRVNIFIGEPNAGKSNIIEALTLLSRDVFEKNNFSQLIRFKNLGDLYFDSNAAKPIKVACDNFSFELRYLRNSFRATVAPSIIEDQITLNEIKSFDIDLEGKRINPLSNGNIESFFKCYSFKRLENFVLNYSDSLATPFGENLPGLLLGSEKMKNIVSSFLRDKGFRLLLKPVENEIAISKVVNDEIYSYPYFAISETFQRVIFMMLAIESNHNTSLLFDEPESNTFPFYTKFIAEQIALDESNQYFISTHNPYLLSALVEKSSKEEIGVFVTYMNNDYHTKLKMLDVNQLSEVLDLSADVFFNLDKFINE